MAPRRGIIFIGLLFLFLTPLVFFDSTRSFAQGFPYPTPTPDKDCVNNGGTCYDASYICSAHFQTYDPGKICPATKKCCMCPEIMATPPQPTDDFLLCQDPDQQGDPCDSTDACDGVCLPGAAGPARGCKPIRINAAPVIVPIPPSR